MGRYNVGERGERQEQYERASYDDVHYFLFLKG